MSDPVAGRPALCLNAIVRNEAHVVRDMLDSVAPVISSWVIVDTGSTDGTQDVIRTHMAGLGIPGELHERPWRNFGHNRTEALELARGRGDYIFVFDADDLLVGTPDLANLTADCYEMLLKQPGVVYWRRHLFRSGLPWRFDGVVHERAVCDAPHTLERLGGDYHIASRRLGARNQDPRKYERDADLLLAEVKRNPEDARSVFYLAQSYQDAGYTTTARRWYERRVELGGWPEEVFVAMYRLGHLLMNLEEPWPEVQNAFLKAWEFRPTRAEPLYAIARQYRLDARYQLGYLFAEAAARIPLPEEDKLFVLGDVYSWQIADELSVCASQLGKHAEAFALCRRLVAQPDVPDAARERVAANRDFSVPTMLEAAAGYPEAAVAAMTSNRPDGDVTVSVVAGPDRAGLEQTLNSFLHCCTDLSRVARFLVVDTGLAAQDRALLDQRYGFVEFVESGSAASPGVDLGRLRGRVDSRFWLHLDRGWRFFAPDDLVTRLAGVLQAEPQVFEVGINHGDSTELTGACAAEAVASRTPDGGRYVVTGIAIRGPVMFDTARLDQAGGIRDVDVDPIGELGRRAAAAGLRSATLDEVLCIRAG